MFGKLRELLGRVEKQVNPMDGGATFNNPNPGMQPGLKLPGIPPERLVNPIKRGVEGLAVKQFQPMEYMPTLDQQGNPTGYPGAPEVPLGQDPANYGYPPDITYDPTGRTPYSARTPELAKMGNRYTANPTSPEFLGVDPAQFGYPEDKSAQQNNLLDLLRRRY